MSLTDLINEDRDNVLFNTSDFANTVIRWPRGLQQQAETVTAIGLPMEVMRQTEGGEEFVSEYELQVKTSQTVHERDIWIIDSVKWSVDRLGNIEYGIRPIQLKRHEPNLSTGNRGGVL